MFFSAFHYAGHWTHVTITTLSPTIETLHPTIIAQYISVN